MPREGEVLKLRMPKETTGSLHLLKTCPNLRQLLQKKFLECAESTEAESMLHILGRRVCTSCAPPILHNPPVSEQPTHFRLYTKPFLKTIPQTDSSKRFLKTIPQRVTARVTARDARKSTQRDVYVYTTSVTIPQRVTATRRDPNNPLISGSHNNLHNRL